MSSKCFIPNCRRSLKLNGWHRFPKEPELRALWMTCIRAKFPNVAEPDAEAGVFLCDCHFKSADFNRGGRSLKLSAVPVLEHNNNNSMKTGLIQNTYEFFSSGNTELQNRWEQVKIQAGYNDDVQFLTYLLDQEQMRQDMFSSRTSSSSVFDDSGFNGGLFEPITSVVELCQQNIKQEICDPGLCANGIEGISGVQDSIPSKHLSFQSKARTVKTQSDLSAYLSGDDSDQDTEIKQKRTKSFIRNNPKPDLRSAKSKTKPSKAEVVTTKNDNRPRTKFKCCPLCSFQYSTQNTFDESHFESHIGDVTSVDGNCVICRETVDDDPINHLLTHVASGVQCTICKSSFPNSINFANHACRDVVTDQLVSAQSGGVGSDLVGIYVIDSILFYRCCLCPFSVKGVSKMTRHFVNAHRDRVKQNYFCSICAKGYWHKNELLMHENVSHQKRELRCDICTKLLPSRMYKKHMRMHKQSFVCDICGKKFNVKNKMHIHRLIHTNPKGFACDFCDKKFTQKSNRDQHQRLHTGEMRYQCEFCERRFIQSSNYVQHLRVHTKMRARDVEKNFDGSSDLRQYKLT